ncbi:transposase [Bradyrhizobium sp. CCGB20]|nr:transposase [Bradyrhizobium sp. CCGB20]MCP3397200.1 transposase [Bradyrhizobium sp. CCGB20]
MSTATLRDENEQLRAPLAQTQAALSEHQAALAKSGEARRPLEVILGELHREKFGENSEKLRPNQVSFAARRRGDRARRPGRGPRRRLRRSSGADRFLDRIRTAIAIGAACPPILPRVERILEPASMFCPCGCGAMTKTGEDVSKCLDVTAAEWRVLVTRRPKYICRRCSGPVVQAQAPEHVVPGGLPTAAAIAQVIVPRCDHKRFTVRTEIDARQGIRLDRATLGNWSGRACPHLQPVADRMRRHLAAADRLFMDETTAPVLDPGRGQYGTEAMARGSCRTLGWPHARNTRCPRRGVESVVRETAVDDLQRLDAR